MTNAQKQTLTGLNVPEGFDLEVIAEWIGDDRVQYAQHNVEADNYTLLVYDFRNRVRYLRFWVSAYKHQTNCSVDYDSATGTRTLWEMLQEKFA